RLLRCFFPALGPECCGAGAEIQGSGRGGVGQASRALRGAASGGGQLDSVPELVADAGAVDDQPVGASLAQLDAEAAGVGVEGAGALEAAVAPNASKQFLL